MRKLGRNVVIWPLAVIGGLMIFACAVYWAANWVIAASDFGVSYQPAPDGKLKVAIITYTGGSAARSHCHTVVSVVPASAPTEQITDKNYEVFSGECASFAPEATIIKPSPQIEWLSDKVLRITISINQTALAPATVRLKKTDASKQVDVQFVVSR